jgi:uncharacterized protein with PIN domain
MPEIILLDAQLLAMAKALRDFGYPTVSVEEVRIASETALRGEKPADVIGMFVEGFLRDAGLLKETPRA